MVLAKVSNRVLMITTVITLSSLGFTSAAIAARPFSLPPQAKQIAKNIFDLGVGIHNGEQVRGYAFIFRQDNHAKPDGVGGGKKDGGSGGTAASSCYAFIGSGVKWKDAENYIVDGAYNLAMPQANIESEISAATILWNDEVAAPIFGQQEATPINHVFSADTVTPLDDKNEVYFSDISDPAIDSNNTIAVTITWGVFSGPPRNRRFVEWDQVYNTAFTFGDASINTGIMDFLGIAAHEVGHAAGMSHPESSCVDETMYAYAAHGETIKRDLNLGDITGIKKLYE
jgi:hypothetical protein